VYPLRGCYETLWVYVFKKKLVEFAYRILKLSGCVPPPKKKKLGDLSGKAIHRIRKKEIQNDIDLIYHYRLAPDMHAAGDEKVRCFLFVVTLKSVKTVSPMQSKEKITNF